MKKIKFKFKSLTMRIWTIFTAIILIIVCCISILYIFAYKNINEKARINDLKVSHDILLKSKDFDNPNRFDELKNLKGSNSFILTKGEGNTSIIKDINKMKDAPMLGGNQLPPPHDDINMNNEKLWMASFINGKTLYEKQYKASYKNKEFIFIISSVKTEDGKNSYLISYMPNMPENSLIYTVMAIGAVFIAIGFIAAKTVAVAISRPLKELEDYTKRIAHKDWKEPIEVISNDEIGRLAVSMNKMQSELKLADEEEKMFLQSISHDLKTPVMVIMSHADAIIDGVYVDSVEKTAEIIRDEAISLEKKIKQLLYLNTLDYALQNSSENTMINLHDLLLKIISRFEVIKSSIEWDLDIDELTMTGNEEKIQISIENIVDNALRYAEGKIAVKLKEVDSKIQLEIYNDGPNIKTKHIDHIFDNMYKDKTGNFGLGLAISKKIVDYYRGEIKVINREKGVSFIIEYPI